MTSYKNIWRKIENLQENQVITANHRGFQWDLSFEWSLVLPKQESLKLKNEFKFPFPIDFLKFLIDYSNGAKLFYDHEYGQWGYWLYSDRELISKQDYWGSIYGSKLLEFFVFGECFGDSHLLLFDTARPDQSGNSYHVAIANPYETADDWPRAGESFSDWLGLLIEAQGNRFWEYNFNK